jgi:hypothetical protein
MVLERQVVGVRPMPAAPAQVVAHLLLGDGWTASAQLPLGNVLEPRPLEIVRLDAPLWGGPHRR